MIPHINLDVVLGIATGIVGGFAYLRSANLTTLKAEIESVRRQVADLTARCGVLEVERDAARHEIVAHYTARTEISEENRELHRELHTRDERIIRLQAEVIDLQKNTLRVAAG